MSQRTVRINELMQREISSLLHTRHTGETVGLTITAVDVAPDLENARVFYAALGGPDGQAQAARFLARHATEIRHELGRRIVLKTLPRLQFEHDATTERGDRILRLLDELGPPAKETQNDAGGGLKA